MFKNLFKNKFALNKIKDPTFPFKKSLFPPIITTSDKTIQIFKWIRVARILLCLAEKISSEYFAKRARCARFISQGNMSKGTLFIRTAIF